VHDARQPPRFWAPNNIVRYTTEEVLDIAAQYTTDEEAARALLVSGGREAIPGSSRVAPSNIDIQGIEKDAKGNKKRQKWHPRRVAIVAGYNDYDNKEADGSDKEYVAAAKRGIKRQAQPPTNHFERLLEAAWPNHAYPIKHKLKDYDKTKNFMTSGALTRGKEPKRDLGRKGVIPFPEEETVMMVYDAPRGGVVYLT
jgi:hypothetical protein